MNLKQENKRESQTYLGIEALWRIREQVKSTEPQAFNPILELWCQDSCCWSRVGLEHLKCG